MQAAHRAGATRGMHRPRAQKQYAELGVADARRIFQHGVEHRLQSPGEQLMTLSTSEVAVCCCSGDLVVRSSLSSRVFSMAMTACAAKF